MIQDRVEKRIMIWPAGAGRPSFSLWRLGAFYIVVVYIGD